MQNTPSPNEAEAAEDAGNRASDRKEAVRPVSRQWQQAAQKTAGAMHKQRGAVSPKDPFKSTNHNHRAAGKQHFGEGAS